MMRRLLLALALVLPATAHAQAQPNTRPALLQQATAAYDNFETARALDLARTALDPAFGPPDSTWVRGLHLLTQVLFENGSEPDARTWARWGMRTFPTMRIDSVNFLAGVVSVLREARVAVGSRTSSDELTRMTWQWPARGNTATQGQLRLDPSPMSVPLNVTVLNATGTPVGQLLAGAGLTLATGTYEIQVSASGYLPARISREVLPGATLTLSFQLTSAAVLSGSITDAARQAAYRGTAALSVTRFGTPAPVCAAGAVTGGRLLLTSYSAIRGADALSASIGGAPVAGDLRVAAYDATSNLAVILLPAARTDSIALSPQVVDGQGVWGIGLAQCRTLSDSRAALEEWTQRPLGALKLSQPVAQGVVGTPVVDYLGRLVGIWTAGTGAVPAPNASALLELARRNIAGAQTLALVDVARRENHLHGALVVTADVPGATVRITPLERWQWAELATSGAAPFTFSGPVGRYRLETTAPGIPARAQEVVIRAGETVRLPVTLRQIAQGGGQPQAAAKKGMPKWVWVAVIGGGAAAAAALGGGGGGGGGGTTGPTTGTIVISVPNP